MLKRWDPLTPEHPHAPADGSHGVVVGNDTGQTPHVRHRPGRGVRLWVFAALVALALVVLAIVFAPPAGGHQSPPQAVIATPPYRTDDRACRCGTR